MKSYYFDGDLREGQDKPYVGPLAYYDDRFSEVVCYAKDKEHAIRLIAGALTEEKDKFTKLLEQLWDLNK